MRISVFADEISPDSPKRALDLASAWGVTHVEVRSFPSGRFPAVPDSALERFSVQMREAGLGVSGVSPGFFKGPWDDPSIGHALSEDLPRACEWAKRLGSDLVTCFAFKKDASGRMPSGIMDMLGEMAIITRRHGCRLALENEAGCWGSTGIEAASIIRQVGSEHIRLCWDPGNSSRAGSPCPYPDEYEEIKDLVSHVHMKNFDPRTASWALMNVGAVDWPGQLKALSDDEYEGFLVIETHMRVSPDRSRLGDGQLSDLESNTLRNLRFVLSCLEKI